MFLIAAGNFEVKGGHKPELSGRVELSKVELGALLPEPVASHYDARGVPNGFQSRGAFVAIVLGAQLLVVAVFALAPALLHRIPPRWVNLPHREYWLRPGRIEEALDRYARWSLWFGCATAVLLLGIFELAIQANLRQQPMDPTLTWALLGGYLLATGIAIVRLYAAFRPPRASGGAGAEVR